MNLSQLSLNKRLAALLPPFFAFVFLFVACGKLAGTGGSLVSYTPGSGQTLIRLINSPGNIFPSIRATPIWELYGNGTLLYQSQAASSDTLLQAQLQPADVAHILDVVVNQDAFFADKKSFYGKMVADAGATILTVNTTKQQKTASLFEEEGASPEDQHMFSILHFLQSYQPASSHPYVAPGIIMLVRPSSGVTGVVAQWPYPDISLQQVAAQECQTFYNHQASSCAATSGPSGYFPLYGKRGTDLFNKLKGPQDGLMSQGSQTYVVQAWALLPENLVVQTDGKQWVQTEGMNGGRWPLLPGAS